MAPVLAGGCFEIAVHFGGGTKETSTMSSVADSLDSEAVAMGSKVGAGGSGMGVTVS